jgi:hypothetical protein
MKVSRLFLFSLANLSLTAGTGRADILRSIPEAVHLHVAPERKWAASLGLTPAKAIFANFDNADLGRWLTLALGPEFVNLNGAHSAAFAGRLIPDRCEVAHSPIAVTLQSWDDKQEFYGQQTRMLNHCVNLRVTDTAGIFPAEQHPACTIIPVNEKEVIANGGLCYFRINPASSFTVSYEINPQCTEAFQLNQLGFKAQDIFAYNGFYISGDATGRSNLLKPLGSGVLRFSVEPDQESVPLSADMGEGSPRWPVLAYPEIHMGEPEILVKGSDARLITKLFFKNNCPPDNDTSCRYSLPIGIQYTLKTARSDGRFDTVDQWYAGGISPAAWEGFFPSQRDATNFEFKSGQRYRLEADVTWLSLYHRLFKEGFKNYLIQLGQWNIDPDAPLLPIPPVARIPSLDSLKTNSSFPALKPLLPAQSNDLQLEFNQLRSLLTGIDWPPYYESMCGSEGCAKALSGNAKLTVGLDFAVDRIEEGRAVIKEFKVWRDSGFAQNYSIRPDSLMKADCR